MKPPPQLLVLLLLLFPCLGSDKQCKDFKSNIFVNQKKDINGLVPVGRYINHQEDKRLFLHCYIKTSPKYEQFVVITKLGGEHVVTIKGMNCHTDKEFLTKNSYMFIKEEPSFPSRKHSYLAFGILPRGSENWCQFDICVDCGSRILTQSVTSNSKPKPDVVYFQWSEKGIPISKTPTMEYDKNDDPVDRDGAVEYISIGYPKIVVICHKNVGAIVRSTMGQHIVTITTTVCPPYSFIQTFYVYTMKKGIQVFPKGVKVYQLDENIKEGVSKWYDSNEDEYSDERMFYYFLAQSSSKMCYWNQIYNAKPNTCISLPHDAMILTPPHDIRETSEVVTMYKNLVEPTILLFCFKTNENNQIKYFSVVTDLKEKHLVTITNIDCSSKENFDRKLFVHSTDGKEDLQHFLVGSRWSVSHDWCTYSIYKPNSYKERKWVYYDYSPKDDVLSWKEEGGVPECPGLEKNNIAAGYKVPPGAVLTSSHLWPADPTTDSLLMYCYNSNMEETVQPQYTNVIKKLNGESIASINGLECLYQKNKDGLFNISMEKINNNNYLMIGSRTSSNDEWCHYYFCVDCEKKEAKLNFKSFLLKNRNKFSLAGVKLGGNSEPLLPDSNQIQIVNQYHSDYSKFALVCLIPNQEEKYKWIFRSTRGVPIATFYNAFECSKNHMLAFNFYIHTRGTNGESNIYSYEDCSDGCELHSGSNTETWFYYFINQGGKYYWDNENKADLNACPDIKRENILTRELDNLQETEKSTYWNGGGFTLTCYHTTEQDQSYAVITRHNEHILTIKDFDCVHNEIKVEKLYIHTTSGDEDISQVVVGSTIGINNWCYYNVFIKENNVWIYYNYKPEKLSLQWYKEGNCPDVMKDNIIINQKSNGNSQDMGNVIKTFVSSDIKQYKMLYCYESQNKYTLVMKSVKGNHELTVKGLDCSKLDNFDIFYFKKRNKSYLVLWTKKSDNWCRYDICMNCIKRKIQLNINQNPESVLVSRSRLYTDYLEWTEAEQTMAYGPKPSAPAIYLTLTSSIHNNQEGYSLIARLVTNDDSKFHLQCYLQLHQNTADTAFTYIAMVTDANGEHIVTILNYDCSQKPYNDLNLLNDQTLDSGIVILRVWIYNTPRYYAICWNCEIPFISENDRSSMAIRTWNEVLLDDCPSLKRQDIFMEENRVEVGKSKPVATYVWENRMFIIYCYKTGDTDDNKKYVSVLRNRKGSHLLSIKGLDCSSWKTLYSVAYIFIKSTEKGELVHVGTRLANGKHFGPWCQYDVCFTCQTAVKFSYDIINSKSFNWAQVHEKELDNNCYVIPIPEITKPTEMSSQVKPKVKYSNGGNNRVTLSCYEEESSVFATITISVSGVVFQLDEFNCIDRSQLYGRLYVDVDVDFNLIILGSRLPMANEWCWYSISQQGENIKRINGYRPNTIVGQWFKEDSQDCSSVKSESILIDENDKSLDNKRLISMYIEVVSDGVDKQKEMFYNYCYYIESASSSRIHAMVIRNMEGRHLATIKDFDCSTFKLEENAYMHTMTDSGYPDYLSFGTRTSTQDEWCQYDICLNCEEKVVRTNINPVKENQIFWEKDDSESCPGVKSKNIFTDGKEKNLDDKNSESLFVMEVINGKLTTQDTIAYQLKEAFSIYCYYEEGAGGKRQLVIRTVGGRHLATIGEFDCSPKAPLALEEKTYMFTLTYSGHKYLALGTRNAAEDKWCRHDICLDCETKTVRRNVHIDEGETRLFRWKVWNYPSRNEKSKLEVAQEKLANKMKLVAKYESRGFLRECYQSSSSINYKYTSVIFDRHGKQVIETEEHDCSSKLKLRNNFEVFIPYIVNKEDDVGLELIDIRSSSQQNDYKCCSYIKCNSCEEKLRLPASYEYDIMGYWVKVPTDICYSIRQENILTHLSDVNLKGYEILATYINENEKDEDTFVLICYKEGGRIITLLNTLGNRHVVSIENLDCSSPEMLSRISYMEVVMANNNRYLALGTRSTSGKENGPWCRYDICISCPNKEIQVNAMDNPRYMNIFKWSMNGLRAFTPPENNCGGFTLSSRNLVSSFVHAKHLEFSIECNVLREPPNEEYCSVFKRRQTPLAAFQSTNCMTNNQEFQRNFYLYTLYPLESEYRLIRLDTKDIQEHNFEGLNKRYEQWLYFFPGKENTKLRNWIQVNSPKKIAKESVPNKEECLPKGKKMTDLVDP